MTTFSLPSLRRWSSLLLAWLLVLGCVGWLVPAAAKEVPQFVAPAERRLAPSEQAWPANRVLMLAYHDIEDQDPSARYMSVRTDRLIEQLAWLRAQGYQAVSTAQLLAAREGGPALPARAVYLSFDDGYRSFSTRVLPILRAYQWPFVIAPVGAWLDTPDQQPVDFGGEAAAREKFLTWDMVRELSRSPLVEVGAHTHHLHQGIQANPQGNTQPAAATWGFERASGRYESEADYAQRLSQDVQRITRKITDVTGKAPRVWVWPYGAASGVAQRIVQQAGYQLALTLEDGLAKVDELMNAPRLLLSRETEVGDFVGHEQPAALRAVHVDLDYVYDPDPEQQERNLGQLVQRIADLQVNAVFLQAFADPRGDGLVRELYFPNRWLPMRADLFNRAAWQLRSRAGVKVFAWMPVLSFDLDAALPRVQRLGEQGQLLAPEAGQYQRLSPFDPQVRQRVGDLYEDLARQAWFTGILFHDDAMLSDYEDASAPALAAYRRAGLPGDVALLRTDPALQARWTRFKSRYLVEFTQALTERVRKVRGPQVATARNLFAAPILQPESEAWFAQNLDDFLQAYDWTAPMAMPLMEGVAPAAAGPWLDRLVDAVARRPGALGKSVFELQARDWRKPATQQRPVPSTTLASWMQRLQRRGAPHFGYYPDDFRHDQPELKVIRPALSTAWFPYHD